MCIRGGSGTEDAVIFVVREGEISRVDGPYAEAKEVVGGWSFLQYDSLEDAVADQREFAELHAKYWPEGTVISTPVSYTHIRAHETVIDIVCRLMLEKKTYSV